MNIFREEEFSFTMYKTKTKACYLSQPYFGNSRVMLSDSFQNSVKENKRQNFSHENPNV